MQIFIRKLPVIAALASMLGGCGGGGSSEGSIGQPAPPTSPSNGPGTYRVVNGIIDSSLLNAFLTNVVNSAQNIALDSVGAPLSLGAGSYTAQLTPNNAVQFAVGNIAVASDQITTLIAYGAVASSTQGAFPVTESLATPAGGTVVIQPVFAAAAAARSLPSTYATGFSFTSTTRNNAAAVGEQTDFGASPAALSLPVDRYRVQITNAPVCTAGQTCTTNVALLFDSGTQGIALPTNAGTAVYQLIAVDACSAQRGAYGSGIVALLLDSAGNVTPLYNGAN